MKNIFLLSLVCTALAACATFDKEAVSKVKKVAIVGYTFDYNMSTSKQIGSSLMGGEKSVGSGTGMNMGKIVNKIKQTPVSKSAYNHIAKELKKTGWQVLPGNKVRQSPTLKAFYNKKVKMGMWPLKQGKERYRREGIPQNHFLAGRRGEGELAKIAKELGVDALVFVYAETDIGNPLGILGPPKYSAKIMLDLMDKQGEKYIMRTSVNGDQVKETQAFGNFDDITEANTFRGVKQATELLVDNITEKIR